MSDRSFISKLVAFDHWAWLFFVIWFAGSLTLNLAGLDSDGRLSFWGIVLLLVCYNVRLIFVAEQFRLENQPRYRLLSYVLLATLLLSVAIQLFR